jgi:uncharacterized protein (DUF1330 family)
MDHRSLDRDLLGSECYFIEGEGRVIASEGRTYLEPTQESGRAFFTRAISGSVVMLNLLRFRPIADYSATPDLGPSSPITGAAAYRLYMEHTLPHLKESGGEILFLGSGGHFLIGPVEERWDAVMLVRQESVNAFLAFASNPEYLSGMGHRLAALEDSRLLPLIEGGPEEVLSER